MSKFFIALVIFTIVLIQVCESKKEKASPNKAPRGDHTDNYTGNTGNEDPSTSGTQKKKGGRPKGSRNHKVEDGDDQRDDPNYYPST
ncbi:unnamed protein product [Meloidogyne enterolobii]|uniref:Uncharacterized protein n=1 Tax=Meloidogyne enterolobii TaxID=390850 RepID=A0ACB0Z5Y2_MELEN